MPRQPCWETRSSFPPRIVVCWGCTLSAQPLPSLGGTPDVTILPRGLAIHRLVCGRSDGVLSRDVASAGKGAAGRNNHFSPCHAKCCESGTASGRRSTSFSDGEGGGRRMERHRAQACPSVLQLHL